MLFSLALFADKLNLLLLKVYKKQNVTDWVMSERSDGIRAYWDRQKLLIRSGNIMYVLKWFIKSYLPFILGRELWRKRGNFKNISSMIRDKIPFKGWKEIKYYIFKVSNTKRGLFKRLKKVELYRSSIVKIIIQIPVTNKNYIKI